MPVSGRSVARRGAEVAIAIARTSRARLHLLYISTTSGNGASCAGSDGEQERARQVLADAAIAAEHYRLSATTSARGNTAPDEAILEEAATMNADLVVLGADRLQGETLDFGAIVATVLARSSAPVLLVSAETNQPAKRAAA